MYPGLLWQKGCHREIFLQNYTFFLSSPKFVTEMWGKSTGKSEFNSLKIAQKNVHGAPVTDIQCSV